jgi:hypothetical protein
MEFVTYPFSFQEFAKMYIVSFPGTQDQEVFAKPSAVCPASEISGMRKLMRFLGCRLQN